MNAVFESGRLTRDPEIRNSANGKVVKFSIAVSKNRKKENEEDSDAYFFDIVCFGKQADFAEKYFFKGTMVEISGRLSMEPYTDKEGRRVYSYSILGDRVEIVSYPKDFVRPVKTAVPETDSEPADESARYMQIPVTSGQPANYVPSQNSQPNGYTQPQSAQTGGYVQPQNSQPNGYTQPQSAQTGGYVQPQNSQPNGYTQSQSAQTGGYVQPQNSQPNGYTQSQSAQTGGYVQPQNPQPNGYAQQTPVQTGNSVPGAPQWELIGG